MILRMPTTTGQRDGLILSAADWCFLKQGDDAAAYYRRLAGAGYAAAEMVAVERREMARGTGLRLLNFAGASGLNRAEKRAEVVGKLREEIGEMAKAGIPQLIVFSGNREGQAVEVGIENCIAALKEVASDAERAGVMLTFEVFNTFDHPDYDADSGEYGFAVARGVSSPAVKVLYDLYHMQRMGEDVAATVIANLEYVAHLHVAGSPTRGFPGPDQSPDYSEVVRQIHGAGYRGAWGMEFLPGRGGDAGEMLERAAGMFRGYVG
jgi:hydroxypyruvate isomerase